MLDFHPVWRVCGRSRRKSAKALEPVEPIAGHHREGGPTLGVVRNPQAEDLEHGGVRCIDEGVDEGGDQQALVAAAYTLSPAGVGLGAFDDGKTVTLVSRQRSPCPGDPMPMPMNSTAWFVLPTGGERTFGAAACTVESTCP